MERAAWLLCNNADAQCPSIYDDIAYKSQVMIDNIISIPITHPPCNRILSVVPEISFCKVTPLPIVSKGYCIGVKLFVCGTINVSLEYVGQNEEETVAYMQFITSFHGLIDGRNEGSPITADAVELTKYRLHGCIEYLNIDNIDKRTYNQTVVLLLWMNKLQR